MFGMDWNPKLKTRKMANFNYEDIGLKDYKECWNYQEEILAEVQADKKATGCSHPKQSFSTG